MSPRPRAEHLPRLLRRPFTGTVSIDAIGSSCPTIVPAVSAGGLVISEVAEASDLSHRAYNTTGAELDPETSKSPSRSSFHLGRLQLSFGSAAGRSRRTATPCSVRQPGHRHGFRRCERPYARVLFFGTLAARQLEHHRAERRHHGSRRGEPHGSDLPDGSAASISSTRALTGTDNDAGGTGSARRRPTTSARGRSPGRERPVRSAGNVPTTPGQPS